MTVRVTLNLCSQGKITPCNNSVGFLLKNITLKNDQGQFYREFKICRMAYLPLGYFSQAISGSNITFSLNIKNGLLIILS